MRLPVILAKPVLCGILTISFYSVNAQDTARYYIEQGSGYYNKGYYDSAISSYSMAIRIDPNNAESYNLRGMAYNSKTWVDSAILDFSNAIRLNPGNVIAYASRGSAFSQKKKFGLAIEDYTKAIDLGHNNSFVYASRGFAYSQVNKPDLAVFDLNKAIALDSNSTHAYGNRGFAYSQQKQFVSAIRDYTKAIRLDTNYTFAYANRGFAYSQRNKPDSALFDLNKAIALDSNFTQVYGYRGYAYSQKNQFDSAILDLTKAIRMDTNFSFAYAKRGYVYSQLKQFDLAIRDFTKTIELEPGNHGAYENRSIAYFDNRQVDPALRDINKAISLNEAYEGYYHTRGNFYNVMGEYDLSIQDFRTCIKKDESFGKAYINIISPLVRKKEFMEATASFDLYRKKKLISFFDNEKYRTYRSFVTAVTLVSRGNMKLALENLENATKRYEIEVKEESKRAFLDILFLKGYIFEQTGRHEEAKVIYEKSLAIDHQQPLLVNTLGGLEKKQALTRSMDRTAPEINLISYPQTRGFTIETDNKEIQITGTAEDESGIDSVKVNGIPAKVEADGYFIANLTLNPGVNSILITATDKQGNTARRKLDISKTTAEKNLEKKKKANYYAILIAEKDYTDPTIPDLNTPVRDANLLRDVLINQYTFDSTNIDTLYNSNREDIIVKITARCEGLTANDNLFIFYAGHGDTTKDKHGTPEGSLVPTSARKGVLPTYIYSEDLKRALNKSNAKHVLIVLDACYSGAFTRELSPTVPDDIKKQYEYDSRKVMASGNLEPVPDNSIFIKYFIEFLKANDKQYLSANDVWEFVSAKVKGFTGNLAQYAAIPGVGDIGGQFIFEKREK